MWELTTPWYELVLRGVSVFLVLLLMFRFFGKKHLGEMAAFDFVLLLIMGEAAQNALFSDEKSVLGGVIVVATLMTLTALMNVIAFYSKKAEKILEGTPKTLIHNGRMMEKVMKKEKITLSELLEALREQGVMRVKDVKLAMIEANGKISVIKKNERSYIFRGLFSPN
jgi:uncharacterized membrane protein YcaP (DUF421 family)